jgi:hypothetical protein
MQGNADVYFAVLGIGLQAVHFFLCSPSQEEFEDVSRHAVEQEAEWVISQEDEDLHSLECGCSVMDWYEMEVRSRAKRRNAAMSW